MFEFGREEAEILFILGVRDLSEAPIQVVFDIPSLFAKPYKSLTSTKEGSQRYRIATISEKGNRIEAEIDLQKSYPFSHISIFIGESKRPVFFVESIQITHIIPKHTLVFPKRIIIEKYFKLINLSATKLPMPATILDYNQANAIRTAIYDKDYRQAVQNSLFIRPDWDKLLKNDEKTTDGFRHFLDLTGMHGAMTK